jgi:hypothetical protein
MAPMLSVGGPAHNGREAISSSDEGLEPDGRKYELPLSCKGIQGDVPPRAIARTAMGVARVASASCARRTRVSL